MRKIYLVKKNPEQPAGGNNWIVMNSFEFMNFVKTPEGQKRKACFGQLDACSVDDVIITLIALGLEIAVDDIERVVIVVGAAQQHRPFRGMHYGFSSVFLSSNASVLSSGVSSTSAVRRISFRSSQTLYCWM